MFLYNLFIIGLWGSGDSAEITESRRNSSDVIVGPTPDISSLGSNTPEATGQPQNSGHIGQPQIELSAYFWEHLEQLTALTTLYKRDKSNPGVCEVLAYALEKLKNPSENKEYDTLYKQVVDELKKQAEIKDDDTPETVVFSETYDNNSNEVEKFIGQCSSAMFNSSPVRFNENITVQQIAPKTYLCFKAQHTRRFGDQNEASDLFIEYGNKNRALQEWAKEFVTNFEDSRS